MKAIARMKLDTKQMMKLEFLCKLVSVSGNKTHGLIAQSVRALEQNSVLVGSNRAEVNFL